MQIWKKLCLILVHENSEKSKAEQFKHRLKAYRNKLISDVEPSALAFVLSKTLPKMTLTQLIMLVAVQKELNACYNWLRTRSCK